MWGCGPDYGVVGVSAKSLNCSVGVRQVRLLRLALAW